MDQFAWYAKNPIRRNGDAPDPADPQRTWPVGQLKPNGLGLFDVYGNVWEWVHDRARDYSTGVARVDTEDPVLVVNDEVARTRRGGSFPYGADVMRSAHRGGASRHTYFPSQRRDTVGFRIAKTIVDAHEPTRIAVMSPPQKLSDTATPWRSGTRTGATLQVRLVVVGQPASFWIR